MKRSKRKKEKQQEKPIKMSICTILYISISEKSSREEKLSTISEGLNNHTLPNQ